MSISRICRPRLLVSFLAVGLLIGCDAISPVRSSSSSGSSLPSEETASADGSSSFDDEAVPDVTDDTLSLATVKNRTLQLGDSWTYEERQDIESDGETSRTVGTHVFEVLAGTVTDAVGSVVGMISGTLDRTIDGDADVLRSVWWYFSQDADGTIYHHGRLNGYVNPPVERFVSWPPGGKYAIITSPITVGAIETWDIIFTDGSRSTGTSTVVAVEEVTVRAGTFLAAKIDVVDTEIVDQVTYSWNLTIWHVPEIGREAKAEFTLSVVDDGGEGASTGRYSRELTAITLAELIPSLPDGAALLTTSSGLRYYDFEVGTGQQPSITSIVTVDYVGYLANGTIFDSGDSVQFDLTEVVEGFADGISTMQEGGRRRLIIPPDLGYGQGGNPGAGIGGDDTIIFGVTLISVKDLGNDADGDGGESGLPPLPDEAELVTTDSGLQYYDFEPGTGQQPSITSVVTVDYVGYAGGWHHSRQWRQRPV